MVITLNNTTGSNITYSSVAATVNANSSLSLTTVQLIVCQDPNLQRDVSQGNVTVSDGVSTYYLGDGVNFLNFVAAIQIASNGFGHAFSNITGNTTSTLKSTSGFLHAVVVGNNASGGGVILYDNTAGSGTVILNLSFGSPSGGLLSSNGQPGPVKIGPLGLKYLTGLTVVTSGSSSNNITVIYL